MTDCWMIYESPVGPLALHAGPGGLTGLYFPGRGPERDGRRPHAMPEATAQLDAYFAGELRAFELVLDLRGSRWQLEVWRRLLDIPFGETESYGALAARLHPSVFGSETPPSQRARAVGAANGRNPISIIVPCHRVIGADGSLTGYGGGLQRKRALLELERRACGGPPPAPEWGERQTSLL
jgi:methylated-DNA-[protein]-cysteine S-methyltransferase